LLIAGGIGIFNIGGFKMKKPQLNSTEKKLVRRYLIWCYKTTKEDFDRIERYFTQLKVDHHVLALLSQKPELKDPEFGPEYLKKINEFQKYIEEKAERVLPQKFADQDRGKLQPGYWYLKNRLEALEKAIVCFLGPVELRKIQALYEEEMTRRIMDAREHT
jgi:hypothetical protein